MIDVTKETVFRLNNIPEEARNMFQGYVSASTLRRLMKGVHIGKRRIALEACLLGGGVLGTSTEACARFLARLNEAAVKEGYIDEFKKAKK